MSTESPTDSELPADPADIPALAPAEPLPPAEAARRAPRRHQLPRPDAKSSSGRHAITFPDHDWQLVRKAAAALNWSASRWVTFQAAIGLAASGYLPIPALNKRDDRAKRPGNGQLSPAAASRKRNALGARRRASLLQLLESLAVLLDQQDETGARYPNLGPERQAAQRQQDDEWTAMPRG